VEEVNGPPRAPTSTYNNGNVGIGTTNPTDNLYIQKPDAGITLDTSANQHAGLILKENSVAEDAFLWRDTTGQPAVEIIGYGNAPILFYTGSAVQTAIMANGNVGIGTQSPTTNLEVVGGSNSQGTIRVNSGGYSSYGWMRAGSLKYSNYLHTNDGLYWANASGADMMNLTAGGNLWIAGALTQNSDARLKTNIISLASSTLDHLLALNPVTYNWKDQSRGIDTQVGFIAQDVQEIFPALVTRSAATTTFTPDGTLTLNYIGLIPYIVQSIEELTHKLATRVETKQLCIQKSDGTDVCVTGDQLAALLAK